MATEITEDALVDLSRDLIACRTANPPGNETEAVEVLLDRLDASPVEFETEVQEVEPGRSNLIARAGDPDGGRLLLTGHTDVVPAVDEEWTGDPFELRREGDRIVGRGTSDMKCAVAAKVVAAESYLTDDPDGEVILALVMGEERGGLGTDTLCRSGIEADGAILGEPTDLDVGVAHKGAQRFHLTVRGRAAHSGRPDKGVSAIRKLGRVLSAVEELDAEMRAETHPLLYPASTVTVTEIEGGIAPNVVPSSARATVDWRHSPGMATDPEWFDDRLREALSGLELDGEPIEVEVDHWGVGRAVEVPEDAAVVEAVGAAARDLGLSGEHVGFNAGTDARFLVHDAGIPTVLFGPGHIEEDAHTADESIGVPDLVTTARVYRRALERFFG